MRTVACLWLCCSAWAQTPQPPTPAKPEEAPTDPKADAATSQSPVPDTERRITGSLDFGYRWQTGPGGNENVYRSIVDLGSGPKLLNADFPSWTRNIVGSIESTHAPPIGETILIRP